MATCGPSGPPPPVGLGGGKVQPDPRRNLSLKAGNQLGQSTAVILAHLRELGFEDGR